ncbi:MAG: hypothetical protein SGBAC_013481 [Bacillariaceae sp.]
MASKVGSRKSRNVASIDNPRPAKRRSCRGNSALSKLAKEISLYRKQVVIIAGAGISVASGVRTFRGKSGVWSEFVWTTATRDSFRKDPLAWYNDFWLKSMKLPANLKPNPSHKALTDLLELCPNLKLITQNVDGLNASSDQVVEAHGRLGLFKCVPDEDSDTDSESDDDDDRLVHLGHRRKRRLAEAKGVCRYQQMESIETDDLPMSTALGLMGDSLEESPKCPLCQNMVAPQALLFDEGYHSHDFYQFKKMEDWLANAEVIMFVGTSFNVRLSEVALEHARAQSLPVYNFNTQDFLEATAWLDATNISGCCEDVLPQLYNDCVSIQGVKTATNGAPRRQKRGMCWKKKCIQELKDSGK